MSTGTPLARPKSEKAGSRIPAPTQASPVGSSTRPRPRPRTTAELRADLANNSTSAVLEKFTHPAKTSGVASEKVKEDLETVVKDLEKHGYLKKHMLETPDTQRQISTLVDRITSGKLSLGTNNGNGGDKNTHTHTWQKKTIKKLWTPRQTPSGSGPAKPASVPVLPPAAADAEPTEALMGIKPNKRIVTKIPRSKAKSARTKSLPPTAIASHIVDKGTKKKSKSKAKRRKPEEKTDENVTEPQPQSKVDGDGATDPKAVNAGADKARWFQSHQNRSSIV